jgi:hypothetical protein
VTNLVRVPLVLVVHPSVPAKNLQELIATSSRSSRFNTRRRATERRST